MSVLANPELRKYLWLELTPLRLLAMPVVLGMLFSLVYGGGGYELGVATAGVAFALYLALALFWGTRLAADSVYDELRQRTWDWQRLSALGPWQLTVGKLLGAPAYAWYGALLCLPVILASRPGPGAVQIVALLVAVAVMLHAGAIAATLAMARANSVPSRGGLLLWLLAALAAVQLAPPLLRLFAASLGTPAEWLGAHAPTPTVTWLGHDYPALPFFLVTASVFAGWAVVAAWRLMSEALAVPVRPLVWAAFLAFLVVFASGWQTVAVAGPRALTLIFLDTAFWVALTTAYADAALRRRDVVAVRRWLTLRGGGRGVPAWVVSWALAGVVALALAAFGHGGPVAGSRGLVDTGPAALAWWLLATRDLALIHWFAFSPTARRPLLAAVVALALLYWLLPGVLRLAGLGPLALALRPPAQTAPGVAAALAAVHVAVALALLWRRWRSQAPAAFSTDSAPHP